MGVYRHNFCICSRSKYQNNPDQTKLLLNTCQVISWVRPKDAWCHIDNTNLQHSPQDSVLFQNKTT